MDIRPTFSAAQGAFGASASVLLPGAGSPVVTTAFWVSETSQENPLTPGVFTREEIRRTIVLSAEDVPDVPRGTIITFPPYDGQPDVDWKVEEATRVAFDHHRCVVIQVSA